LIFISPLRFSFSSIFIITPLLFDYYYYIDFFQPLFSPLPFSFSFSQLSFSFRLATDYHSAFAFRHFTLLSFAAPFSAFITLSLIFRRHCQLFAERQLRCWDYSVCWLRRCFDTPVSAISAELSPLLSPAPATSWYIFTLRRFHYATAIFAISCAIIIDIDTYYCHIISHWYFHYYYCPLFITLIIAATPLAFITIIIDYAFIDIIIIIADYITPLILFFHWWFDIFIAFFHFFHFFHFLCRRYAASSIIDFHFRYFITPFHWFISFHYFHYAISFHFLDRLIISFHYWLIAPFHWLRHCHFISSPLFHFHYFDYYISLLPFSPFSLAFDYATSPLLLLFRFSFHYFFHWLLFSFSSFAFIFFQPDCIFISFADYAFTLPLSPSSLSSIR